MAPRKDARIPVGTRIGAAEHDIWKLLNENNASLEDANKLWNYLKSKELKSMREDEGLIELLNEKHITRMWEIAACRYSEIAVLMAPDDKDPKALHAKTDEAPNDNEAAKDSYAAVVDVMLPQAVKPTVKWIVKRGEIKRGSDRLRFPWERSSKEFKEKFEMTISNANGDKPNEYRVRFGGIGGENSKERHHLVEIDILLSLERNPHPLPHAVTSLDPFSGAPKSCVVAFTFGVAQEQIIVYIRFAGPTMLVGKAFKANWATKREYENLWGDLVLAKY